MAAKTDLPFDIDDIDLDDLLPMMPEKGPPLPIFLELYWPWYKPPAPPGPPVPPEPPEPPSPPGVDFKLSELLISPEETVPGAPVTVSVTVSNVGSQAGNKTVVCEVT